MKTTPATLITTLLLASVAAVASEHSNETPEGWYQQGQQELQRQIEALPSHRRAKNIILFVGDGLGVSTVTASRIYDGQQRGQDGEENQLNFETLPYLALSKTYNTNAQVPDSAGTMTAMMTGVKTGIGLVGVSQNVERGDCAGVEGNTLMTFLEQAEHKGMSTGIVSTARITHATPAATYAHAPDRNWEADSDIPEDQQGLGCKDIARQLLEFPYGDGLEVALGGGRRNFIPNTMADPEDAGKKGDRADNRNLTREWVDNYPDAAYVWNQEQFDAIDPYSTRHLLGLFDRSHMEYEADRAGDSAGEPSLAQMTDKALDMLQQNRRGYFLMVEAGRIDHGHHAGNAQRALRDTLALAEAVKIARQKTSDRDTLIIVTADHSHVMTMAGYPKRGNPILGLVKNVKDEVALAGDNLPYTTLGYANGPGTLGPDYPAGPTTEPRRVDLNSYNTQALDFRQESLIPLRSETHSGEDVAIYAGGPWAQLFRATHEQNYIYHVMNYANNHKGSWYDWSWR